MKPKAHMILELNLLDSFKLVKSDIVKIQDAINQLSQNQERIMRWIQDTREKEVNLYQRVKKLELASAKKNKTTTKTVKKKVKKKKKTTKRRAKVRYIASKTGKKLHLKSCPFAKNIKPKSKVTFKSKTKALNEGFKRCECLKKV